MLGTVKYFDEKHGFGFITCLGIDQDIFVHYSQIKAKGRKVLRPGQEVSFRLVEGEKGPAAEAVRVMDEAT
ncbi:MAG: cold shock domain-containing protein [bacterium]|jgi:CspA family cold shock protein|nr:cold shock domain-containing protein [bacterium]